LAPHLGGFHVRHCQRAWAGNAAIVSAWVFYVDALFGIHNPSGMANWGIALIGRWVPATVNLAGVWQMAWFQNVTVVLKFLPLLFVGVVGWFFVSRANFGPFNASGGSLYSAIGIAAGVALFSFIGVEVAAMTAKRVRDPSKKVGRASLLGTGASAILYLLVAAVVMGLVSHSTLVHTGAPFVNAFDEMFTHATWAGRLMAGVAVGSGIGALNGWTLVTTEVPRAAANDGLFPQPFAWVDRKDTAWFGIVMAALLPSLLMLWRYTTSTGLTVFTELVDLTVVTVAIPYFFSACAQLAYLVSKRRRVQGMAAHQGSVDHRGERAVLAPGHLRRRLPGRVPGHGGRAGRASSCMPSSRPAGSASARPRNQQAARQAARRRPGFPPRTGTE
jgi:APA family basic amino acid/polyamine antiporter